MITEVEKAKWAAEDAEVEAEIAEVRARLRRNVDRTIKEWTEELAKETNPYARETWEKALAKMKARKVSLESGNVRGEVRQS